MQNLDGHREPAARETEPNFLRWTDAVKPALKTFDTNTGYEILAANQLTGCSISPSHPASF
jgi:hypothetical protein